MYRYGYLPVCKQYNLQLFWRRYLHSSNKRQLLYEMSCFCFAASFVCRLQYKGKCWWLVSLHFEFVFLFQNNKRKCGRFSDRVETFLFGCVFSSLQPPQKNLCCFFFFSKRNIYFFCLNSFITSRIHFIFAQTKMFTTIKSMYIFLCIPTQYIT